MIDTLDIVRGIAMVAVFFLGCQVGALFARRATMMTTMRALDKLSASMAARLKRAPPTPNSYDRNQPPYNSRIHDDPPGPNICPKP